MTLSTPPASNAAEIERLLRDLAPQALGVVARRYPDFAAAEDAVQEALIAAVTQWPGSGIPGKPLAWLCHVALRRVTDYLRSEISRRRREDDAAAVWAEFAFVPAPDAEPAVEEDDTLVLLFMCCHPSLTTASAVALTLRAVGGLTTAQIARAFLVPEATMAQRISRAKQTIRESGIPFEMPGPDERDRRLAAVLHVLYLIFNEGYAAASGRELQRIDLSEEAIRLARLVRHLLPRDPEAGSILALLLLTHARKDARATASGELIPLDEQDRSLWDREMIEEGARLVAESIAAGPPGPYGVQAAIAALHDEASSFQQTDWPQILALYDILQRLAENPVVALNRAVAVAMVHGPRAGLETLDALEDDSRLRGSHRLAAVRAHLLERTGQREAAAAAFVEAAEKAANLAERDYLRMKALRLRAAPTPS